MKLHWWYLDGETGAILYAGKFKNDTDYGVWEDDAVENGTVVLYSFCGKPQIEAPCGGDYSLVVGDLVTVEVAGGVADITGSPEGIEIEVIDHDE